MRACATASSLLLGLALAAGVFAACGNAGPPPQPPPASGTVVAPSPVATGAEDIGVPAPPVSPAPKAAATKPPESIADCTNMPPEQIKTDLTNEPDGGTCMNNAMTTADAGSTDRCEGMADAVKAQRNGFRCCYDLYSRTNKNQGAHIVLHVDLLADGTLKAAALNKERSSISPPEIEACMVGIAKGLRFPKSPRGRETGFNYPFDFKPHY